MFLKSVLKEIYDIAKYIFDTEKLMYVQEDIKNLLLKVLFLNVSERLQHVSHYVFLN